jgi:hypothetical protein
METSNKKHLNEKAKFSLNKVFAFQVSPRRQFRNLTIVWAVIIVLLTAYHVYFFKQIESQSIFETDMSSLPTLPKVNTKKLDSVLERYEIKKNTQSTVLKLDPFVSEPSK